MFFQDAATRQAGPIRQALLTGCLVVMLSLFLPTLVRAAPPGQGQEGASQCDVCHAVEGTAWQTSPHASKGITCETCHGPFVEEHPKKGVMQLTVDSAICNDCHLDTYHQWSESPHAAAGVQCIGCHLSHSQSFRLTDEALCSACHRDRLDDQAHASHLRAEIACTECHVSGKATSGAVPGTTGQVAAPNHSFTFVSEVCVVCHVRTFHEESQGTRAALATGIESQAATNASREMAAKLESAERGNRLLQTISIVNLGLGIGLGGMIGIVGVLVVSNIGRGKGKK